MENDITKNKNDLLRSIMKNPKLSKTFGDAFNAPIGSTIRDQAKSMFSVMKKTGGANMMSQNPYAMPEAPNYNVSKQSSPTNYGNSVIFQDPGVKQYPQIKVNQTPEKEWQPGLIEKGAGFITKDVLPTAWDTYKEKVVEPVKKGGDFIGDIEKATVLGTAGLAEYGAKNIPLAAEKGWKSIFGGFKNDKEFTKYGDTWGVNKLAETQDVPASLPGVASSVQSAVQGDKPLGPEQFPNLKVATDTDSTVPIEAPTEKTPTSTTSTVGSSTVPGTTEDTSGLKEAVADPNVSPQQYAQNYLDKKYGDTTEYMDKMDKDLRGELKLNEKEIALSNAEFSNATFSSSLGDYMRGKDEYLTGINQMIEDLETSILDRDMGDPSVANLYNKGINYLYTLKGRQSQRYSNYLNDGIEKSQANVDRIQTNYNNDYKKYSDIMNRDTEIFLNEYNNDYARMVENYNYLEQAPDRIAARETMRLQNLKLSQDIMSDAANLYKTTNEDYYKDRSDLKKAWSTDDGTFNMNQIGPEGLPGLLSEVSYGDKDTHAAMNEFKSLMSETFSQTDVYDKPIETIKEYKDLITDLADYGEVDMAQDIYNQFESSSTELLSDYVLNNLEEIKDATNNLVKKGFENPSNWKSDYDSLDSEVLNGLYNATGQALSSETYQNNPSLFVEDYFDGDEEYVSKRVAGSIVNSI